MVQACDSFHERPVGRFDCAGWLVNTKFIRIGFFGRSHLESG